MRWKPWPEEENWCCIRESPAWLPILHARAIRVTVLDNGSGIPQGVRRNLFAPFYTTKGEKGTGLGLWISRGITEKHEGTIHVSSRMGTGRSGTAFSVFLPFEQELGLLDISAAPPEA